MTEPDDISSGVLAWDPSIENLLVRWCDEAKCFEWMHTESYSYYDTRARRLMICSNVLTAISGLSNVIAGGITVSGFQLAWAFGSLSIIVSITNMLQEKLAYVSKATEHLNYSVQWGTIRRKIEEVISISPDSRKNCRTFMKYLRQDINQVSVNGNAMIPHHIRQACYTKFNSIDNFNIPDICGQMEHTRGYDSTFLTVTVHNPSVNKKDKIQNPQIYAEHSGILDTLMPKDDY